MSITKNNRVIFIGSENEHTYLKNISDSFSFQFMLSNIKNLINHVISIIHNKYIFFENIPIGYFHYNYIIFTK